MAKMVNAGDIGETVELGTELVFYGPQAQGCLAGTVRNG
jgi:hypothetical protein